MPEKDFEMLLLEAVDEALSSLGESSKQAIYFHLNKNFNIERHEIPSNIKAFVEALEEIFGLGASFLEILIMKRLQERVGEVFRRDNSTERAFIEYVTMARQTFLKRNRVKIEEVTEKCEEVNVEV